MSEREFCSLCGGDGEVFGCEAPTTCPRCHGEGFVDAPKAPICPECAAGIDADADGVHTNGKVCLRYPGALLLPERAADTDTQR